MKQAVAIFGVVLVGLGAACGREDEDTSGNATEGSEAGVDDSSYDSRRNWSCSTIVEELRKGTVLEEYAFTAPESPGRKPACSQGAASTGAERTQGT